MSITIDKEFESLIPPLSSEEFAQLEENCVKEGIRDALITWNGILVDGHNRFKIAAKHSLHWTEKKMDFADRDEAMLWIIDNQFGKRNLQLYDRGVLELRKKELLSRRANDISKRNLKQFSADGQKSDARGRVDEQIGKRIGASRDTVRKIEVIEKNASPETKQQIRDGKKSINGAFNEIKEKERKQIDISAKAHLEKAEERNREFQESKTVSIDDVAQNRKDTVEIARGKSNELFNAIKKILFIGATPFDYSIINTKTMDYDELRRLQGEINIAIGVLTRIKKDIGG